MIAIASTSSVLKFLNAFMMKLYDSSIYRFSIYVSSIYTHTRKNSSTCRKKHVLTHTSSLISIKIIKIIMVLTSFIVSLGTFAHGGIPACGVKYLKGIGTWRDVERLPISDDVGIVDWGYHIHNVNIANIPGYIYIYTCM